MFSKYLNLQNALQIITALLLCHSWVIRFRECELQSSFATESNICNRLKVCDCKMGLPSASAKYMTPKNSKSEPNTKYSTLRYFPLKKAVITPGSSVNIIIQNYINYIFTLQAVSQKRREIMGWVLKGKTMAKHRGTNAFWAKIGVKKHICNNFRN